MSDFPCTLPANAERCRVVMIPGPPGPAGTPCTPCSDGANAYGTLLSGFTMPAVGNGVPSKTWYQTATTDATGHATWVFHISPATNLGLWTGSASATRTGYRTGTATYSFTTFQ